MLIEFFMMIAIIGILVGILFLDIDLLIQTGKTNNIIRMVVLREAEKVLEKYNLDYGSYPLFF